MSTRFTESELNNLCYIYVNFAEFHAGVDQFRFGNLIQTLLNIQNYPIVEELFLVFDTDGDGVVWFEEFIRGLNTMERGDFNEKCYFAFSIYDVFGRGCLDLITLRHIMRKCYSTPLISMEKARNLILTKKRWNWEEF
jgi:Ca2+-binding EF-hand superfamily protein